MSTRRGFSVVELLVAVVILGLALAVAVPSIVGWTHNLAIRNAAESLKGGIEKTRQVALRRNADMTFWLVSDASKALSNACVRSLEGPSWVIAKLDPAGLCGTGASETVNPRIVETWSAAEGAAKVKIVTQDAAGNASDQIVFNSLGQVTQAGQITQIDISHLDGGDARPLRILIGGGGSVRMCDPAVAAGDTRAC
jgi:type IV fimbrial biogenesis protein FimT